MTHGPLPKTVLTQADRAFTLGFLGDSKPELSGLFKLGPLDDMLAHAMLAAVGA
ncbi:MAG: hypothetical protein ACRDHX_02810 [Chloroflexota bacterium]